VRGTPLEIEFEAHELPELPEVIFEHPPLVLVICQVRYNTILNVTNASFVAPFQSAIQDRYPVVTTNPVQEVGIQLGTAIGESNIIQGAPSLQWQFSDQDDNWKVVLTPDFLAIETRRYDHFDNFLESLRIALNALIQNIKPTGAIRIGLRYINEIRQDNMDWPKVIRRELLGPVAVPELINNTTQLSAIQQIQLKYPNEQGTNINHGLLPSGTIVLPRKGEQALDQAFYLLDFDAFREFPPPKTLLMNSDLICHQVRNFHRIISQLFYWSVTQEYLATLKVRGHVGD
jgi:uncharacterized protein (TIGR04255 family)